jgi:hypothetical protein
MQHVKITQTVSPLFKIKYRYAAIFKGFEGYIRSHQFSNHAERELTGISSPGPDAQKTAAGKTADQYPSVRMAKIPRMLLARHFLILHGTCADPA